MRRDAGLAAPCDADASVPMRNAEQRLPKQQIFRRHGKIWDPCRQRLPTRRAKCHAAGSVSGHWTSTSAGIVGMTCDHLASAWEVSRAACCERAARAARRARRAAATSGSIADELQSYRPVPVRRAAGWSCRLISNSPAPMRHVLRGNNPVTCRDVPTFSRCLNPFPCPPPTSPGPASRHLRCAAASPESRRHHPCQAKLFKCLCMAVHRATVR